MLAGDGEDFISPFELAFQQANQNMERRRDRRKKTRFWEPEEDDEDLITRTIAHHRRSKGL